jgi:GNAT superfamily N-acetyltransferase
MAGARTRYALVSIAFRWGGPADAAALAQTHIEAWRETYTHLVPAAHVVASTQPEKRLAMWEERTGRLEPRIVVAEEDGVIVGFASAVKMPDTLHGQPGLPQYDAYLEALYLLRRVHGQGLGRDALSMLAHALLGDGYTSLAFHVFGPNPSRAFYEHLGAQFVREEPADPAAGGASQLAYAWPDITVLL